MRDIWALLWLVSVFWLIIFPQELAVYLFFISLVGMVVDWYVESRKDK